MSKREKGRRKRKIDIIMDTTVKEGTKALGAERYYEEVHVGCLAESTNINEYVGCATVRTEELKKKPKR